MTTTLCGWIGWDFPSTENLKATNRQLAKSLSRPEQPPDGRSALIHYHGGPITPQEAGTLIYKGRHAMVSFAHPNDLPVIAHVCQSFALDNGAFSFWRAGKPVDWSGYYQWVETWMRHPGFDWAVIPDVIDGGEEQNDELLAEWPFLETGVPVWHLHESLERLERMVMSWPRIALGSSGRWADPKSTSWWSRIAEAMAIVCDEDGRPRARLHGLRMLDKSIFTKIPLSSCDSTNVARNVNLDKRWSGPYQPATSKMRGLVLAERIEAHQSCAVWTGAGIQPDLYYFVEITR